MDDGGLCCHIPAASAKAGMPCWDELQSGGGQVAAQGKRTETVTARPNWDLRLQMKVKDVTALEYWKPTMWRIGQPLTALQAGRASFSKTRRQPVPHCGAPTGS